MLRDLVAAGDTAFGYNRSTSGARKAVSEGYDVSDDLPQVLRRAEEDNALIVVAVPMLAVGAVLDQIAEYAPSFCGISDVVSVKWEVYAEIRKRGMEARYVGGHPMAGTSESGWNASRKGLFERATWAITYDYADQQQKNGQPIDTGWIELFTDVVRMASTTGAEAIPARVVNHDHAVARVSHLPHLMALALSVTGDNGGILAQSLAAGSFKDATRVAGTNPELIQAMCETNSVALCEALEEAIELLAEAHDTLSQDPPSIRELAVAGNRARRRLEARTGARRESVSPVKISSRPVLRFHPGSPGWVNQLRQTESTGGRMEIF